MESSRFADVTVIIRSSGERTEAVCHQLIIAQGVPPENVIFVRERPFRQALITSYISGIENSRKWTCCVDADVLLAQGAIESVLQVAEKSSERVFEIQGMVLDRFIGGPRTGGVHFYRTSLLPTALELVPKENDRLRPESGTIIRMSKKGYNWVKTWKVIGLHDYGQYYFDIFRTCFVHAKKHQSMMSMFLKDWQEHVLTDKEFEVAYLGLLRGLEFSGKVNIDIAQPVYRQEFEKTGIAERTGIVQDEFNFDTISTIIKNYKPSEAFLQLEPSFAGFGVSRSQKIKSVIEKLGPFKATIWFAGYSFKTLGEQIMKRLTSGLSAR